MNQKTTFAILGTFILGIVTFAYASATPQPSGQPFQQLQQQIDAINQQISSIGGSFVTLLQFNQEVSDRQTADNTLQTNIDSESAARIAADSTLQSNIDHEAASRMAADNALQTRVSGNCAVGSSIRQINSDGTVVCETAGAGSGGSLNTYIKYDETTCPAAWPGVCSAQVNCNDNDVAISGGYFLVNNPTERALRVGKDFPIGLPQASGWAVEYVNEHPTLDMTMRVYAVCNTVP